VQKCAQIVIHPHGVHEDERHLSERQHLAVASRSLAFTVVQVKQIRVGHAAVVGLEIGIDVAENISGAIDESPYVSEGLEGRTALRVRGDIPRPQRVKAHPAAPPLHQPSNRWKHSGLNRLVKAHAVVSCVVKAILLAMGVVAEVVEVRISSHLLAQVVHVVEDARELIPQLDVRLGSVLERALAHCSVVRLEKGAKLSGSFFLALPFHRHRTVDLRPFGLELRQLGEKGHVGLGEQLHLVLESLNRRFEARPHVIKLDQAFLQPHPLLAGFRRDLHPEPQLRRFAIGIRGVARIGEACKSAGFRQQRLE